MAIPQIHLTIDLFEQFIAQSEYAERRFELIDGEVIDVPSNPLSSQIAMFIVASLVAFVRPRGLGHITGEAAGYIIGGNVISPDIAFVSAARQERLAEKGYNPIPPDLAVEVISPTDEQPDIRRKLSIYAGAGVLVWLVYPQRKVAEVYPPDAPVQIMDINGALEGGAVLPGFTLPVREIFPE